MFLIKKIGFNNTKNYNPKYEEIIGVIDCTKEEAERWINAHNPPKDKQYKGYDGKYYPYYVKIPINSISLNDTWSVTVYDIEYKNFTYTVNNIIAINEEEAIFKAKKFVASNGYFPGLSIKQTMNMLKVEKVERKTYEDKKI